MLLSMHLVIAVLTAVVAGVLGFVALLLYVDAYRPLVANGDGYPLVWPLVLAVPAFVCMLAALSRGGRR